MATTVTTLDTHHYRDTVGCFPTGVTVVTSAFEGRCAGMTLNSFTSISLNPLLILIALAHQTRTLEMVRRSGQFAVNILHRGQQAVALDFAANGASFPAQHVGAEPGGYLVVRDALAVLRCSMHELMPAGDHDLVLGEVERCDRQSGEPLVFHRGMFGGVDGDGPTARRTARQWPFGLGLVGD
jgi:3-hydroxy-9,10-secoandrosta-1,3,5(10)-triene-9,17-dione monooxygenase reductase component